MKRVTKIIIAAGVFIAGVLSPLAIRADASPSFDNFYPQTYIVVNVDEPADRVTIETCTGYIYTFYGVEDWCEGDLCACIMYDNDTPEIWDDIIVKTRYSGIAEWFEYIHPNHPKRSNALWYNNPV